MNNVVIFIRSYAKDVAWLEYTLRSIKKFARGFAYTFVTVPKHDRNVFEPMMERYGVRLHIHDEPEGKGMCAAMMKLCHADELCPGATHFLSIDCDCIFKEPVCPEDYFVCGKPVLIGESFDKLERDMRHQENRLRCQHWRIAVRNALGFDPPYETMVMQPIMHATAILAPFRAAVEKHTGKRFDDYVLGGRNEFPWEFAEFPALGAFALAQYRDLYHFVDVDNDGGRREKTMTGNSVLNGKILQHWSHGGVTKEIAAELEQYLE